MSDIGRGHASDSTQLYICLLVAMQMNWHFILDTWHIEEGKQTDYCEQ